MNVIISNKYQTLLSSLDLEVIKAMNGEFEVEEIISNFQNFFFQRMIIDVTAIKDHRDIKNLQKLSIALDMDKIILLLDDTDESSSNEYLSKLISMGIYNFTKTIDGVTYLYNNPNSYRDVAHIQQLDASIPISGQAEEVRTGPRILGVKNITLNAGSSSLIYMMKKQLEKNYEVAAIEIDKKDFQYFRDNSMISVTSNEAGAAISRNYGKEIILVDVNTSTVLDTTLTDVIYLIEPSILKLNRLMLSNGSALKNLKDKKVVLNRSLLSSKDVLEFEYEARLKVFYNLPPLDDREKEGYALNKFLIALGFTRQEVGGEEVKKNKILGIF